MNQNACATPEAIKKDSPAPLDSAWEAQAIGLLQAARCRWNWWWFLPATLDQAICLLREEHTSINKELSALPAAQWLEPHGQQLANREQELHITIDVLERMLQGRAVGNAADACDAARYRWLRSRDLETISQGGVFAGMTPENVILNGEDLDEAVDAAIAAQAKQGGKA